jgi:hypothetical protein
MDGLNINGVVINVRLCRTAAGHCRTVAATPWPRSLVSVRHASAPLSLRCWGLPTPVAYHGVTGCRLGDGPARGRVQDRALRGRADAREEMSGKDCTYKAGRLQIYRVEPSAGHWTRIIAGRCRSPGGGGGSALRSKFGRLNLNLAWGLFHQLDS